MDKNLELYYPTIDVLAKEYKQYMKHFGMASLPTGVDELDHANMFTPGNFIVVGAEPAMGKSAFIYMMMKNQVKKDIPVAYFTTENLNHPSAWARLVSSLSDDMQFPCWSSDCNSYTDKEVPEMSLYVHSTPLLTVDVIREHANLLVRDYGVKVVYIDNLHSVALAEDEPTSDRIKKVCQELKTLAYKLRIPIVITSDVLTKRKKDENAIEANMPRACNLKGCKYIKDIADVVLLLYRPEYYHLLRDCHGNDLRGVIYAIIEKNTFGATFQIPLHFNNGRVCDSTPESEAKKEMSREEAENFLNSSTALKDFTERLHLEIDN